jgi:methyltransferase (TIGR00027 family)
MIEGQPSRTAMRAATHRAVHQVLDGGAVFTDPLAVPLLGLLPDELATHEAAAPEHRRMRFFICGRSRLAEDWLAEAVSGGLNQLVVLGAGLDSFAYRNPFGSRLSVFEVDHPATQAWKRERLAAACIAVPPWLRYVGVDFEREDLGACLAAAGYDAARPGFFMWLGVVPYLTRDAIAATLGFIAGLPGGAHVVFDYADPPGSMPAEAQAYITQRAAQVASVGEAWISYFEPQPLADWLHALGFGAVEDLNPGGMLARLLPAVDAGAPAWTRGGHVVHAVARKAGGFAPSTPTGEPPGAPRWGSRGQSSPPSFRGTLIRPSQPATWQAS